MARGNVEVDAAEDLEGAVAADEPAGRDDHIFHARKLRRMPNFAPP